MSRNNDIDWEKIERLYRLGQLSVREIARQCATQASTIIRRAKKDSWTQDLSMLVRQKSNATLLSNTSATPITRADIDVAVATVVDVVRSHRRGIESGRNIVNLLMQQLCASANTRDELEGIIDEETKADATTQRRAQLMRAVSLPAQAGVLRDLTAAMKNLIPLERQAFNIGDEPPKDSLEQLTDAQIRQRANELAAELGLPGI